MQLERRYRSEAPILCRAAKAPCIALSLLGRALCLRPSVFLGMYSSREVMMFTRTHTSSAVVRWGPHPSPSRYVHACRKDNNPETGFEEINGHFPKAFWTAW